MAMSSRRICVLGGAMVLLMGVVGCGGAPSSVNGIINYKGIPVTGGLITLHFDGSKQFPGSIDAAGKFAVQNLPTGKAKVTIDTESIKNVGVPKMQSLPGGNMKDAMPQMPGGTVATSYMKIPAKYADVQKTDLTMDVQSGPQTKNFDLVD